jgi:hypothetical protein
MTIKDYYVKLQMILDDYYNSDYYEGSKRELAKLIQEAKDAGLKVNTTLEILDEIEPYSSYEEESSYEEDDYDE